MARSQKTLDAIHKLREAAQDTGLPVDERRALHDALRAIGADEKSVEQHVLANLSAILERLYELHEFWLGRSTDRLTIVYTPGARPADPDSFVAGLVTKSGKTYTERLLLPRR